MTPSYDLRSKTDAGIGFANLPTETQPPVHHAFRAGVMYLIAALLAFGSEVYLAWQSGAWQMFVVAIIGAILTGTAAVTIYLVKHERPQAGIKLLIWASLAAMLISPFLVAGFGLILGLGTILIVLTIALLTLPQKEANRILIASVGLAIVAGGLDLLSLPSQISLPLFSTLISTLGGFILLIYGVLIIRQFRLYPLTTKLIIAFLVISLMPLAVLAYLNSRHTRDVLTEQAQQALLAAVTKTATDIDTFIKDNLETIRTEAQLPSLSAYLNLPVDQRPGSVAEMAVMATLEELSRKDKVFIDSYALLDSQGRNSIDTYSQNIGQDESERDYFQKPFETGLPYVSSIQFLSPENPDGSRPIDQSVLYFSSPIYNPATSEIIGILRIRYKSMILQQLIVQNNSLIGDQSYAILFDENYIRLAHGIAPQLIFQPVAPLDPLHIERLQAARRLHAQIESLEPTDLPDLAAGLDNALFEPYFTTQLEPTGDSLNLAVVRELDTQPWSVVFAQPQTLFLAPIQAQTRTTLFLAIAIAGVVAAAAFAMGQLLANPLVELTKTVTQFTAGDLDARTHLRSSDESGVLAASFNTMAEQVGKLLRNLAERTQALESEISDRKRAENELQISEKKYRRLFEDSKDTIFISTPNGRIVDINPAGLNLFGYSRPEMITLNAKDLYAREEDLYRFQEAIEEHGLVRDFEVKFRRKDGTVMDGLITATIRQADEEATLTYQGIIRDITTQKRAEQERLRLANIQSELTLARTIQQSLLPPPKPNWTDLEVICYTQAAYDVGGDFYQYHQFSGERPSDNGSQPHTVKYAFVVGDVSGKGVSAALLMATGLSQLDASLALNFTPAERLAHLDKVLGPYTKPQRQNCALCYVEVTLPDDRLTQINTHSGQLHVVNAGGIPPYIKRRDGSVESPEIGGFALGQGLGIELGYQTLDLTISEGDLIILTSDGVVEANNAANEMFGFKRLQQAVATGPTTSAEAMLAYLRAEVNAHVEDTQPHDDITIVVVRV